MINIILKKPTITRIQNEDSFQEFYMKSVYKKNLAIRIRKRNNNKNQNKLHCYYLTVTASV
jgi:hypothetical protein